LKERCFGDEMLITLNEDFFGLATLLNRLVNNKYEGKKIKFINIDFATTRTYELHNKIPKDQAYYFGGHLRYYGLFNREEFNKLSKIEQNKYIWDQAFEYLNRSAKFINNHKLLEALSYAYTEGLSLSLNPNFRVVEKDFNINEQKVKASVWINFAEDGMYSKITLEKSGKVFFEKQIDKVKKGNEFFLEIYKDIEIDHHNIIIKGRKDVDYLPLKIPFSVIPV
jgi:hypothetical protein